MRAPALDVEVEPVEDQPRAEALDDPSCLQQGHALRLAPRSRAVVVPEDYLALKFARRIELSANLSWSCRHVPAGQPEPGVFQT